MPRNSCDQEASPPSGKGGIVNSSAYGFCIFPTESLPSLREDLYAAARNAEAAAEGECLRGTILLSIEGVNIRLSGTPLAVKAMKAALRGLHGDLGRMEFKDSLSERVTLPRMIVKLKKEVISMGDPNIQPAIDGLAAHISPEDFRQWLDEGRDMVVLDTRNDYEVRLGTFDRAVDLNIKSFRAFPARAREELKTVPKDKPVVMFCTGGVRCEKASHVLLRDGHREVYQLDGGILKYFERVGGAHYRGDCYIFDDRVALQPDLAEAAETIACFSCRSPLTPADQSSMDFVEGSHCPYCKHGKQDFRSSSTSHPSS